MVVAKAVIVAIGVEPAVVRVVAMLLKFLPPAVGKDNEVPSVPAVVVVAAAKVPSLHVSDKVRRCWLVMLVNSETFAFTV